jgi:hypothetical protein
MEVLVWSCTRVEMDVDFTRFTYSACFLLISSILTAYLKRSDWSVLRELFQGNFLSISSILTAHLERSDWSVLRGLFQGNFRRISSVLTALFIAL